MAVGELTIRRVGDEDRAIVVELCRAALGWSAGDVDDRFFAWKHDENPFGPSPMWLAVDPDGRPLGVRAFLRWRFRRPDGAVVNAVRAVDTATHPEAQGRGVFTRLTLGALPELRADGVDAVFNTPNDKSRPGYLKMGWNAVGRVPVAVRPNSVTSLRRLVRARTAAQKWSEPLELGVDPAEAFRDDDEVVALLRRCGPSGMATDRDPAYLRWRYGFGPLHYRVLVAPSGLADGCVVARVRRRGPALECAVVEVLVPDRRSAGPLIRRLAAESRADHVLVARTGTTPLDLIPAPGLGPILTWRPVATPGTPALRDLSLSLGDIELF